MTTLKLRILFDAAMLGPGKAELLAQIAATGSIAAAGRQMGMSYKRAWMLVEEMNRAFRAPLVASLRGGPGGGGAQLTEAGVEVLRLYHRVVEQALAAAAPEIAALEAMLRPAGDISDGKERLPLWVARSDMFSEPYRKGACDGACLAWPCAGPWACPACGGRAGGGLCRRLDENRAGSGGGGVHGGDGA